MKDCIYILVLLAVALICFYGGYKFDKPKTYNRGWKAGANSAVEWVAIALMKMGWQGKELENVLNRIAAHLNDMREIKEGLHDEPRVNEKGGVAEN